ncbi:MAG: DMT family transporter [Chloroflexi bacterium]|nr:DMT family transporter [Chloroflexota bacterium]
MLGIVFALVSSFSFSVNTVLARRGLARASASAGAFVTVMIGVPLFLVASLVTGQLFNAGDVALTAYAQLAVGGVIHFGFGRYCNYRAVSAIGATRTSPIQALTVPFAVLFAFLFLGEKVNIVMGAGIALMLVGPAMMVERTPARAVRGASDTDTRPAFELKQAEGYLFAALSVVFYGTSPILIRAALAGNVDLAVFGGLIAYTAAAGALIATLVVPARRDLIGAMRLGTVRLFLAAGFFVFAAQMFRFIALSLAPVAVITPLQRTGAIFVLGLSWAVNRHLEKITWQVVAGLLFSVAGAVLLVASRQS